MYRKTLLHIRKLIRKHKYVVTIHADEEMDSEQFTIFDVETCILNGKIIERQKNGITGEWKYVISGKDIHDEKMIVVCKISITGKLVIITVFSDE